MSADSAYGVRHRSRAASGREDAPVARPGGRSRRHRAKYRRRRLVVLVLLGAAGALLRPTSAARLLSAGPRTVAHPSGSSSDVAEALRHDVAMATSISALRGRVVQSAESQLGYQTSPPNTYCNKYSAYWVSGGSDCGNANMDEEWCADFAAWVWQTAGAPVVYQYINGDLTSTRRTSPVKARLAFQATSHRG